MKRRDVERPSRKGRSGVENDPSIDELYGLEPVLEPGAADGDGLIGGVQFRTVQCPYCGEPFETQVDLSSGSTSYFEDCRVCCQPIKFTLEVAESGALPALTVRRSDD